MSSLCALQGGRKSWWVQKQFDEALLVFDRQTDDLGFIDRPVRNLLSSGNHEIADTTALKFRGALDNPERTGRNAGFYARGAVRLLGHSSILL